MEEIAEFSDHRHKGWCVHCGNSILAASKNWDHVPSKVLLDRPLPLHTPQIEVCISCNTGFSLDEEYFAAFLSCVLSGSSTPDAQADPRMQRALARNPSLVARLEASKQVSTDRFDKEQIVWCPETERINNVVVKNARGHAFFEFGEPMLEKPGRVWAMPLASLSDLQRAEFENLDASFAMWPEVGSRMMTRVLTGQDLMNGWINVQTDVYRYSVIQEGGLLVRTVIRNYLATEVIWE
jgi:hypothetical protein